jgi:hypothetical protein
MSLPSSPLLGGRRRAAASSTIALCTALALTLAPGRASAQLSDADKASARALAQQGQDALEKKDFTTAADRFARAGELVHAPTLTLGLARAQVGLGKWIAATETYYRLLHEPVPAAASPVYTKALADARKELAALEPRIPSVTIVVKGAPSARGLDLGSGERSAPAIPSAPLIQGRSPRSTNARQKPRATFLPPRREMQAAPVHGCAPSSTISAPWPVESRCAERLRGSTHVSRWLGVLAVNGAATC